MLISIAMSIIKIILRKGISYNLFNPVVCVYLHYHLRLKILKLRKLMLAEGFELF